MSNHLLNEKSPYLLQHAQNPVDWYPWSEEAFQKAKDEDKPVFLSIGYSTCHWCHVMAHESFEDEEIARILNTCFIPVKVDREERPEIDMVYMSICQAMTGQGGWPLTIIMTPDKKPFFAGTYLPKRSRYNLTGLWELLTGIARLWSSDRNWLLYVSQELLAAIKSRQASWGAEEPSWKLAEQGFQELKAAFDKEYGGFGQPPKFPTPHNLLFLLMFYSERNEACALAMAEKTLTSMARGGIHDQLGGGFSRYSTDEAWLTPHFEKMLYDNALLTLAYLEGYRLTNSSYYKRTAQHILSYVDRELRDREGGFYCGQDADSQGVEGKYYIFSAEEIGKALGNEDDRRELCLWFGITKAGNFEGKNIPNLIHNQNYANADSHIDKLRCRLYEYRLKRMPLHKDDKILSSWNAMMIMAYAKAAFLLNNASYEEIAKSAQKFMEKNLVDKQGRLLVRYRKGESAFPGNLDDYAYYSLALLSLYELTLDINYLELAVRRAGQMAEYFWDSEHGGFYFYGKDAPELIHRPKEIYDGAIPSGNSAAAHVLLSLANLTADQGWRILANRHLGFLAAGVKDYPSAHSFSLMAFIRDMEEDNQLVCVSAENKAPQELYDYMKEQKSHIPYVLFKCPDNAERLSRLAPFTKEYQIPEHGVCYYFCQNHTCGLPSSSLRRAKPTADQSRNVKE